MKKIFFSSLVVISAIFAMSHTTQSSGMETSAVTLVNIEALSKGEGFVNYDNCCLFSGIWSDICVPDSGPILYGYYPC